MVNNCQHRHGNRHHAAGFTLVELLVVLVILGLLAGIVGPQLIGNVDKANLQTTETQIESLGAALDMFRLEVGRYPNSSEGLRALVEAPGGVERWNGPYMKNSKMPKDAWGNEFHYRVPSEHGGAYDIYSLGADNAEGGAEDVVSWD